MIHSVNNQVESINLAKMLRRLRIISESQYQKVYWDIFFYEFNSETMMQEMRLLKSPTLRIFQAKPSADD